MSVCSIYISGPWGGGGGDINRTKKNRIRFLGIMESSWSINFRFFSRYAWIETGITSIFGRIMNKRWIFINFRMISVPDPDPQLCQKVKKKGNCPWKCNEINILWKIWCYAQRISRPIVIWYDNLKILIPSPNFTKEQDKSKQHRLNLN